MGDFTLMGRPAMPSEIGNAPIRLEQDNQGRWVIMLNDGTTVLEAILPDDVVDEIAARIVSPQPVTQTQVQWGIRWAEDPGTVQGPLDEDYAKRKASPSYGDVVVRRTRTDYRPTFTAWEPVPPTEPWQGLDT